MKICPGSHVSCPCGPLVTSGNSKGKVRSVLYGVVLKSLPKNHWVVHWRSINAVCQHAGTKLTVLDKTRVELDSSCVEELIRTQSVGRGSAELDKHYKTSRYHDLCRTTSTFSDASYSQSANVLSLPNSTSTSHGAAMDMSNQNTDESAPGISICGDDDATGDLHSTFDPSTGDLLTGDEFDYVMLREEESAGYSHMEEKKRLMGTTVMVGKQRNTVSWTVVDDDSIQHRDDEAQTKLGVAGFDFGKKCSRDDTNRDRINLLGLVQHLWPGDWKRQIDALNRRINAGVIDVGGRRNQNPVSERELWVFFGIMLVGKLDSTTKLWGDRMSEGFCEVRDLTKHMPFHRFKYIRENFIPYLFSDPARQHNDKWWQIQPGVELFNKRRCDTIIPGQVKVMDETMTAYKPRLSPTGNLPHLTHIPRKPEPLGVEFKTVADCETGIMLHLEIQRGKREMDQADHVRDCGKATVACSLRMALATHDIGRNNIHIDTSEFSFPRSIFIGDSWFASVQTCSEIAAKANSGFIGIIKTSSAGFPLKFLQEKMSDWPSGTQLLLKRNRDDGDVNCDDAATEIYAIGYKYSRNSVIPFVFSSGSGHLGASTPYIARWIDDERRHQMKEVPRPEVASKYFGASNAVDTHNHVRQDLLGLERIWVTKDGYFRLATTLFALTVVDAMKAYTYHLGSRHRHKQVTLRTFINMLAEDMILNDEHDTPRCLETTSILPQGHACDNMDDGTNKSNEPDNSATANDTSNSRNGTNNNSQPQQEQKQSPYQIGNHRLAKAQKQLPNVYKDSKGRLRRGQRSARGRCVVCNKLVVFICEHCPSTAPGTLVWCCPEVSKQGDARTCFRTHATNGD